MDKDNRTVRSRLVSRRRMIVGSSLGMLAFEASAQVQATSRANSVKNDGTVEDRLAIADLIYRYGIALDSLDRAALEACFVPGTLTSKQLDGVIEYHRQYAHTMHNVSNHTYRIRGRAARGVAYCVASMVKEDAGKLSKFDIYCMYRDELAKQGDEWLVAKRELEVVFQTDPVQVQPGAPLLGLPFEPGSFRKRPRHEG